MSTSRLWTLARSLTTGEDNYWLRWTRNTEFINFLVQIYITILLLTVVELFLDSYFRSILLDLTITSNFRIITLFIMYEFLECGL